MAPEDIHRIARECGLGFEVKTVPEQIEMFAQRLVATTIVKACEACRAFGTTGAVVAAAIRSSAT